MLKDNRQASSGKETRLTTRADTWGGVTWSPDGKWIAFTTFVPTKHVPLVKMITPPPGANRGPPLRYIEKLNYRADGEGYLPNGYRHIFVLAASGGTPRQVTGGPFDDGAPVWAPDGNSLVFPANRTADAEYNPLESQVYEVALATGTVTQLTHGKGTYNSPALSPDGKLIAYSGSDDQGQGYQTSHLYVMNRDGTGRRRLAQDLDRDLIGSFWSADGSGLHVQYDDEGDTKLAFVPLAGDLRKLADKLGGLSIDRPSGGAEFTVAADERFAFTLVEPDHPADLATGRAGAPIVRVTHLIDPIWEGWLHRFGSCHAGWGHRRAHFCFAQLRVATVPSRLKR